MSGERAAVREWDAPAYHRVSNPQVAWGIPVLRRLPLSGDETVVDAGCGTGRLTARLLERVPRGTVICVDRSSAMLNMARDYLAAESSRVRCVLADLADLPLVAAADAIFSTATFHWVPDHSRLFACLHTALRPGGRLVAQCGGSGNLDQLHSRARALMGLQPYCAFVDDWYDPWEFADATTTARRLATAGFVDIETDIADAPVMLSTAEEYAEFVSTVVLRLHLARLPDEATRRSFLDEMTARAAQDAPPFCLDYRRLNMSARRLR